MIWLRYSGLFLVFLMFTAVGCYKSYTLVRRRKQLNEILTFLNRLSTNIRYNTDDIFSLVSDSAEGFLLSLNTVESSSEDYKEVVNTLPITKRDAELLCNFFNQIGTTDVDGQLSHIKLYEEFFREECKKAKDDIDKKSKLYRMSGLFSGLAFVVLFI